MNKRMVLRTLGVVLRILSLLLVLPIITAICYGEKRELFSFACVAAGSFFAGSLLLIFIKTKNTVIYAKEGFAITAFTWIIMAAVGALPFVISGVIPSYVDAFFETVSGFTTTGSSILESLKLDDLYQTSKSMLLWRSFTHWVGGMGVLVFVMAIIPNFTDRSIHIMRAEMPGPVIGKLLPKAKSTSRILYVIYIALTLLQMVLLCAGNMPLFDSIVLSFGTAGTGGFAVTSSGIGGYSPYCQWVIAVFMFVFGVNFNLYFLVLIRRVRTAVKSSELWCYIAIAAVSTTIITANIMTKIPEMKTFSEAVRHAFFQVGTIMSTTGYATADFDAWPNLSKAVLFLLMFCGGCAGSTAGGLKVSRVIMLFKAVAKEIRQMIFPRSVSKVRFEGKPVDDSIIRSVSSYFVIYMICLLGAFLLIAFEPFDFETNVSAVVTCFNNVGPGFSAVGPMANFASYTDFSKIVLSFAMLLGRLEIFPLIVIFSPHSWIKKNNK
ncbi:MAG: TrkH family potassium uptake protein [Clostridia bacterium]|nr:TrkH family potassium uptake protein [Clostridia bacterium]